MRRAFLLGEGPLNRRESIQHRLQELAEIFGVTVGGCPVVDNRGTTTGTSQTRRRCAPRRLVEAHHPPPDTFPLECKKAASVQ